MRITARKVAAEYFERFTNQRKARPRLAVADLSARLLGFIFIPLSFSDCLQLVSQFNGKTFDRGLHQFVASVACTSQRPLSNGLVANV